MRKSASISPGLNFAVPNPLGFFFEYGQGGVDVDRGRAFLLCQPAAGDNNEIVVSSTRATLCENPRGIANLGRCYEFGITTGVDFDKAEVLYLKSAKVGGSPRDTLLRRVHHPWVLSREKRPTARKHMRI
jgi:TPR repeat protein